MSVLGRILVAKNETHHLRDISFGEDRCQVRKGAAPQAMAALRNTGVAMLHWHGVPAT